ncbi:hypothetical protein ILUMI_07639, partial [Ignelater luminosus]
MNYLFVSSILNIIFVTASKHANNVCKTFPDYYKNLKHNPNCFYNPDIHATVQQMIERHGYPFLNYTVVSEDGYVLSLFRIPHGKASTGRKMGRPVFIGHGMGGSSVHFTFMGNKSLAFNLADKGYDVWLANFRGCQYSNKHIFLNENEREYWNFTFNEVGIYDVPALLDLVVRETRQKVIYIGFSMGTTASFIYSSEFPEMASRTIDLMISLAPIAYLHHATTPATILSIQPLYDLAKGFLELITNGAVLRRTPLSLALKTAFCLPYPFQTTMCFILHYILFGYDPQQEDP